MEFGSYANAQDKSNSSPKHGVPEDFLPDATIIESPKEQSDPSAAVLKVHKFGEHEIPSPGDTLGEVNMEVHVTADEVMRAGGFGAADDISSILPVASDFTDFEDHHRKVQECEDSEDKSVKDIDYGNGHEAPESRDAVNMEASVSADEVARAGGFGARDDISSFLPVASDFTDFEAYLRDARDYEDLNEETKRPGLGWTSETK